MCRNDSETIETLREKLQILQNETLEYKNKKEAEIIDLNNAKSQNEENLRQLEIKLRNDKEIIDKLQKQNNLYKRKLIRLRNVALTLN